MHQIKGISRVKEPVIGDWLFLIEERMKEMKLSLKFSSLRNRYGHMKPHRGPEVVQGSMVNTFVQHLFKKTLVHSIPNRIEDWDIK